MNGTSHDIGEIFGTYTITNIIREKNIKKYIVKCICGATAKYIGSILRKGLKCRFCHANSLIGSRNFKSTFIKYISRGKYICKCDCGNEFIGRPRQKSCGCHKEEYHIEEAKKLENVKFGNLKIKKFIQFKDIKNSRQKIHRTAVYEAKCICGKIFEIDRKRIFLVKTCGCRTNSNMACGERQGNSKNNSKNILAIRELFLSGTYTKLELAEIGCLWIHSFDATINYINEIISGKSWKHLKIDPEILSQSPVKNKFYKRIEKIKIGHMYGKWLVIEKSQSRGGHAYHLCMCTCGNKHNVLSNCLRNGKSTKCYNCNAKNLANINRKVII